MSTLAANRRRPAALAGTALVLVLLAALLFSAVSAVRRPIARRLLDAGMAAPQWEAAKAERRLRAACWLSPDPEPCLELARHRQRQGDFLAAERALDRAGARSTPGSAAAARVLDARGVDQFSFSRPDRALALHAAALALAEATGDLRLAARARINRARVLYYAKAEFDEAETLLSLALADGRRTGDPEIEADALRNLGVVAWYRGETKRSVERFYLPALALYRQQGDLRGEAITLSNLGLVGLDRGDLAGNLRYQLESLAIKQRIGDLAGLAESHAYLGGLYADLGLYPRAYRHYRQGIELAQRGGYELGRNESEARLAEISVYLGRLEEAMALYRALIEREAGAPGLVKYSYAGLAGCHLRRGEFAEARRLYQRALALERRSGELEIGPGLESLVAQTYLGEDDLDSAARHLARALAAADEDFPWPGLFRYRLVAGELERRHGRRQQALAHLLAAVEIEARRFTDAGSELLAGRWAEVYEQLFALLLGDSSESTGEPGPGDARIAFEVLELLRYRSLRNAALRAGARIPATAPAAAPRPPSVDDRPPEELRRAHRQLEHRLLGQRLTGAGYPRVGSGPAALEEVQAALPAGTALVEYLEAADRLAAVVVTRDRLQATRLPLTRRELAAKVKLLRALLFDRGDGEAWRPVAADLHQRLIAPLEAGGALDGVRRIGLVPFGHLHELPFAALVSDGPGGGRFLVEDYTLFHAPSASFLVRAASDLAAPTGPLISFGYDGAGDRGRAALRFAEAEASAVAELTGGAARLGPAATEAELKRLAPAAGRLHIAAHALAEPHLPLFSRLELGASEADDGSLTVPEILDLRLAAGLVTLGACRSGESFSLAGGRLAEEDRFGLVEAFLLAGASGVVASLLPVDDASTPELMRAFYRNQQRLDAAEALAEAQRAMLSGGGGPGGGAGSDAWSRPRHWAPFFFVGTAEDAGT